MHSNVHILWSVFNIRETQQYNLKDNIFSTFNSALRLIETLQGVANHFSIANDVMGFSFRKQNQLKAPFSHIII